MYEKWTLLLLHVGSTYLSHRRVFSAEVRFTITIILPISYKRTPLHHIVSTCPLFSNHIHLSISLPLCLPHSIHSISSRNILSSPCIRPKHVLDLCLTAVNKHFFPYTFYPGLQSCFCVKKDTARVMFLHFDSGHHHKSRHVAPPNLPDVLRVTGR